MVGAETVTRWMEFHACVKQQKGRPFRDGPNIHNRYLMMADQFVGGGFAPGLGRG
jgi:hypothetical protein